jgi:heme/copper-type cytochrome/quinol oxidase subunit 2
MPIHLDVYAAIHRLRNVLPMKRLFLASTLGIVLLLTALPAVAGSRPSGYPITIDVRATAKGDFATPNNFAVQPNHVVVLRIRNYTRELHTFAMPAIGLNVAVLPGRPHAPRTTLVRFVVPSYGVFRWFCWTCQLGVHGHGHPMGGKVYAIISTELETG